MKNYKLGVAISVYDKLEELSVCVELLKEYSFISRIVISVQSDSPVIDDIKNFDADDIIVLDGVRFKPNPKSIEGHLSITTRIWDSQRLSLQSAAINTDAVMHIHADAWALSGEKLEKLLRYVLDRQWIGAFRGTGFTNRPIPGSPLGEIDDHFYIIRSEAVRTSNFLRHNALRYLPHFINIHGILALWFVSELGVDKLLHYDNSTNFVSWDGTLLDVTYGAPVNPLVFCQRYDFLHCHTASFDNQFGEALQADFLKKFKKNGFHSRAFIEKYGNENIAFLIQQAQNYEREMSRQLERMGFDIRSFHRNLGKMKKTLASLPQSKVSRAKIIAENHLKKYFFKKGIFPVWRSQVIEYPQTLREFYSSNVTSSIFSESYPVWWKQ